MKVYGCDLHQGLIREALSILSGWVGEGMELLPCPLREACFLAEAFARIRVISPEGVLNSNPFPLEVDFEARRLKECKCGKGAVCEGRLYSLLLRERIEGRWHEGVVIVTADYLCSREKGGDRYHLRYAIFDFPTVISLPGIIEAPARRTDRECLRDLEDPRIPRILAALLLQARFFFWNEEPFCDDPFCSLYNAHWQEELLLAQRDDPYLLCERHSRVLDERRASILDRCDSDRYHFPEDKRGGTDATCGTYPL